MLRTFGSRVSPASLGNPACRDHRRCGTRSPWSHHRGRRPQPRGTYACRRGDEAWSRHQPGTYIATVRTGGTCVHSLVNLYRLGGIWVAWSVFRTSINFWHPVCGKEMLSFMLVYERVYVQRKFIDLLRTCGHPLLCKFCPAPIPSPARASADCTRFANTYLKLCRWYSLVRAVWRVIRMLLMPEVAAPLRAWKSTSSRIRARSFGSSLPGQINKHTSLFYRFGIPPGCATTLSLQLRVCEQIHKSGYILPSWWPSNTTTVT